MRSLIKFMFATALVVSLHAEEKWLIDAKQAKEQAAKEGKAVLMDFTGSDWCAPCKLLKSTVLESDSFKEFAAKNFVLLEVDFPTDKKKISKQTRAQNEKLSEQYKIKVFPSIVILDKNGNELGREEGYGGESPADYIKKIESILAKAK